MYTSKSKKCRLIAVAVVAAVAAIGTVIYRRRG